MTDDHKTKVCSDCAEVVRAEARKCRFCGYRFDGATEAGEPRAGDGTTTANSQAQRRPVGEGQLPPGPTASGGTSPLPKLPPTPSGDSFWNRYRRWVIATDMATYVSQLENAIARSRRDSAALSAQDALSARQRLLSEVEGWDVPSGAQLAQSLLEQALRASIISDQAYTVWMRDIAGGDHAAAKLAYARAQANDPNATALKRRFISAYNQLREQVGLTPLPKTKLF